MNFEEKGKGDGPSPVWCDQPPAGAGNLPFYIAHPRVKEPVAAWLLAEKPVGVLLHWMGDRSFPCLGDRCGIDHAESPLLWYGYLPAVVAGVRVPTLLGLTVDANRQLAHLRDQVGGLRGVRVRLSKSKHRKNARVRVELLGPDKNAGLPPTFDPIPYLLRMWGLAGATVAQEVVLGDGEVVRADEISKAFLSAIADRNGHTEGGQ